jgi:hypothetical protein
MADKTTSADLNFTQACEYLALSPDEMVTLREQRLAASFEIDGRQLYPKTSLELTRQLLQIGRKRSWSIATLAWYADLLFTSEIGRAILLPIRAEQMGSEVSWLASPYANAVLDSLKNKSEQDDTAVVTPLRSLIAIEVGKGRFWSDLNSLRRSPLYPLIEYLEHSGIPILDQVGAVARDAGAIVVGMLFAFSAVTAPLSEELADLAQVGVARLKGNTQTVIYDGDTERITLEGLVAVDKLYASKATEIHAPPDAWDFKVGIISAGRRTVMLEMKVPSDAEQSFIDNIIDLIRPFVGTYGARVCTLLYTIANDAPFWRNPQITFETNDLLDQLGLKRTAQGYHHAANRRRLRDTLEAAHNLEIVGEYTVVENGKTVRKAFRRTVLSIIGASFDADENAGLTTTELFRRGLPKTVTLRLNFYEGVRRQDGKLGNQYVLVPRLGEGPKLHKANHATTQELLKTYLLFRYRQTRMKSRTLTVTRQTALEKANITDKKERRATATLRKALDRLVAEGILESYSALPRYLHQTFEVILSQKAVSGSEQ